MERFMKIFSWLLIVFILYIIIEVIRKILGGSLESEDIITGLVLANLGYTFSLNMHMNQRISSIDSKISALDSKLSEHIGWHKGKDNHAKTL